jgi:hypothetical protein
LGEARHWQQFTRSGFTWLRALEQKNSSFLERPIEVVTTALKRSSRYAAFINDILKWLGTCPYITTVGRLKSEPIGGVESGLTAQ